MTSREVFLEEYAAIAVDYLESPTERELYRASMLGREVVRADFGPLEVTSLHFEVVERLMRERPGGLAFDGSELRPLLLELMSVYDAFHQSVRDLVGTLEERCRDVECARREIQSTSLHLENIIRSMNDALVVVGLSGVVESVNQTTLAWLRCEETDVVGHPVSALFGSSAVPPLSGERLEELVTYGNLHNISAIMGMGRGPDIPVSLSARVMEDQHGKALGVVVVARDVAEVSQLIADLQESREQLREKTSQLVQTEKLKALGELAAGVAHELNQPLNVVRLTCEDVIRDVDRDRLDPDELREGLRDVVGEVRRMAEIIDHMRIYSRRTDELQLEVLDARAPVQGVMRLLGQQLKTRGIDVTVELEEGLRVRGDPVRLEQVVMNLVSNARDAVMSSGPNAERRISVSVAMASDPGRVCYEVVDSGPGIAPEALRQVFEPFFTTKVPGEGTGLGLSVSAEIVKEHGGTLDASSVPGQGARFVMLLPLLDEEEWP